MCILQSSLRLVFTSDGSSRSRSRNQKRRSMRSSENQTDGVRSRTLHPFMTPSHTILWKLHCRSRKQKQKSKPITMFDSGPCDWLGLPLLLDHKRRSHKRNRKKMETFWFFRLRFRRAYDSAYDSVFRFSLGHKRSYDSDYDSDSDSVASENQP